MTSRLAIKTYLYKSAHKHRRFATTGESFDLMVLMPMSAFVDFALILRKLSLIALPEVFGVALKNMELIESYTYHSIHCASLLWCKLSLILVSAYIVLLFYGVN